MSRSPDPSARRPRSASVSLQSLRQECAEHEAAGRLSVTRLRVAATHLARKHEVGWSELQRNRKYGDRLRQRQLIVKDTQRWAQRNFVGLLRAQKELSDIANSSDDPTTFRGPSSRADGSSPGTVSRNRVFFQNWHESPLLVREAARDGRGRAPRRTAEQLKAASQLLYSGFGCGPSSGGGISASSVALALRAEGKEVPPPLRALLPPPVPQKVIGPEEMNRSYERQQGREEKRREKLKALEDNIYRYLPRRVHDAESEEALVSRLADDDVWRRREILEANLAHHAGEGEMPEVEEEDDEEEGEGKLPFGYGAWRKLEPEASAALAAKHCDQAVADRKVKRQILEERIDTQVLARQRPKAPLCLSPKLAEDVFSRLASPSPPRRAR
eukprot:Hpha_TRINITY_DN15018_c11_g1::TRINITY_DN15018_c11_g1_i1::g.124799::m.124799